jgi:ribokinase
MARSERTVGRVVVVGSVNADLVVSVPTLPGPGETVTGGTFARHGGGKGANQAVAAARLGAAVTFVGAVGDDDLGAAALRELSAEGVDVAAVARLDGVPTGVALIAVDRAGENAIAVASGANAELDGERVAAALHGRLDGRPGVVLLGHEVPDAAVLAGVAAARAAGWTPILNPAPARALPDALLAHAPLLTPNATEACALSAADDPEAAALELARRTGAPVLVTLGASGALLVRDGRRERIPAPRVDVVDTTGAGDALNGALAAELAAGADLREAASTAVAAASLSTRRPGARGGMPRRDEL